MGVEVGDTLQIVLKGKDEFTAVANQVNGSIKQLNGNAKRVGTGLKQTAAGLGRIGIAAGVAAAGGLVAAAKAGADFQSQLNTINTISHFSGDLMTEFGDGLRKLAREGRGELADLSAGFYDVLSAGITDTTDAFEVLDAATKLSIGGLATTAQTVDILTTAINSYGQDATEAARDADIFAAAIERGKLTADDIASSFASVAPIAAANGIEIEEIAAAYAQLTSKGVPAAEVTTQMSRAILTLLDPGKELKDLQKDLKVNFLDIASEKGLVVALQQMRDAVDGDVDAFQKLFGRVEGFKFALQVTGDSFDGYNENLKAMGDSAGTAEAQMKERTQGLSWAAKTLWINIQDAGIELSQGFLPALERSANRLREMLDQPATRGQLRKIGEQIGDAIDGIDWKQVIGGVAAFVELLKTAFSIVSAIPPQIVAAGGAWVGLNKLSGGLLGTGLKNIAGGLAGGLAKGLAARAPVAGKLFAQPVFVTNWPMGGLGGGGGGGVAAGGKGGGLLAKAGLTAVVAGAIVAVQQEISGSTAQTARELTGQVERFATDNALTRDELIKGILATNEGIQQIKANPLLSLVGGNEAQAELQKQQDLLKAQLAQLDENNADDREDGRNLTSTISSRLTGLSYALQNAPPPLVNVNVNVTGREVSNSISTSGSYGATSSSYYGGSTAPTYSH